MMTPTPTVHGDFNQEQEAIRGAISNFFEEKA